jgi:hypothetical protein
LGGFLEIACCFTVSMGNLVSEESMDPPKEIRWSFERWRSMCDDTNPDALMFPTTRVGKSGVHVPMHPKNFMKHRNLAYLR